MSILNYQNLTLTYNEQEILHHIDLMIPKNQITVIVGQSGSGKSTSLKATMGLLSDDAKIIELNCPHYVQDYEYATIAEEIKLYLSGK